MKYCGVDPGLSIVEAGVFRTDRDGTLSERLAQIERDFAEVLDRAHPGVVAVEELYSHYKHPRTAILMGHARGVILAVAQRFGVAVCSFSATRIKRLLTGNGRAPKRQVQRAVQSAFALASLPEPHDAADALAIALCCAHASRAAAARGAFVA